MIDRFTKAEFEAALPTRRDDGSALWSSLGIISGEFCYLIPATQTVSIMVRSSMDYTGVAADTGQNSIRVLLVRGENHVKVSHKLTRLYVTRQPGWQDRLKETLRYLWRIAQQVSGSCPKCGSWLHVFVSKQERSDGMVFKKCGNLETDAATGKRRCDYFEWLPDSLNLNLMKKGKTIAAARTVR